MNIYLVGGAVRDELLGVPIHDRDWVVVGATHEEMIAQGFVVKDADFFVYLHPKTHEEYALARLEYKQGEGYKGFDIDVNVNVSLQDDLIRRDLTINAMAKSMDGELIDPFNGQQDLNAGFLRHISPAFNEDPFRVLRVARFAATLGDQGFRLSHGLHRRMKAVVASSELKSLSRDRIWLEVEKALNTQQPWRFFEVLHQIGALAQILPEISRVYGQAQAHEQSCVMATRAMQRLCRKTDNMVLRCVLIFQYAENSSTLGEWINAYPMTRKTRELIGGVVAARSIWHVLPDIKPKEVWRLIQVTKALKNADFFMDVIQIYAACWPENHSAKYQYLLAVKAALLTLNTQALIKQGFVGKSLGIEIERQQLELIEAVVFDVKG